MSVCSNEVGHLKAQVTHDAIDEPVFTTNPTNLFAACPQGWNKKVLFFRYYTQDEAAAREANSKTKPLPYPRDNFRHRMNGPVAHPNPRRVQSHGEKRVLMVRLFYLD